MSGIIGVLNDLYIRFLVWLGAEPPPGYEFLLGAETGPREYFIKPGDTLFSVARRFNVHYERIAKANGLEPSATLPAGQKLLIPPANWDPSSGPLAQLQLPLAPPVTAIDTYEAVATQAKPEAIAPHEETEPFVEVEEPQVTPADEPTAVVAEEPAALEEELMPELPAWLKTQQDAEEVAAPAEPVEPVEVVIPPIVAPPTHVEPVKATAPPPEAPPVDVEPAAAVMEQSVTAPEREELFLYEVQRGDTVNGIANRYGVTVAQLLAANDLTDSDRIFPGQKLIIP
ncbi:MAG: LysM peptidoglycan-binding domain-containing protein, partial [Chloroflexi bacterium]|nr:LysM peptidoglycan-binding domain-containing protein [Chloroflexota bacterium]